MNYKINIFLLILCSSFLLQAQDFNPGPYGIEYFDIAGPFAISDLNSVLSGDVNGDEIVNVQDIILTVSYVLSGDYNPDSDLNNDNQVDVFDIILIVNNIITPPNPMWSFEEKWNGEDTYIFISYSGASGSSSLWNASDREAFLLNSPDNVHYFFVSDRPTFTNDINSIKASYDEILESMSDDLASHWNRHLHFVPTKVSGFDNWLTDALQGKRAIAIDRFQRIREIGYLGNPNGFTGTYVKYISHEAIYFNSEWNNLVEDESTYDEITIWEREFYSGWWGATISTDVIFPSQQQLANYSGMSDELLRGCPDCGLFDGGGTSIECDEVINYSDNGCDDYDRIARMYICDENEENCNEAARWITPFARQPHHLTDISPMLSLLGDGGNKTIRLQESGWPNSLITMKFRFYHNTDNAPTPKEFIPIWNGTVQFNPDYNDNRPPTPFLIPENAEKVEFVSIITGHGWGDMSCYNCCEFCNSRHLFQVNGGTSDFSIDFPTAGATTHCMSNDMIAEGTIPNQYGTWGYGRAGWCPGLDVDPFVTDITDAVFVGEENIIDYEACRVSGGACLAPPTCGSCGYCPEVAFSSYIVIYY